MTKDTLDKIIQNKIKSENISIRPKWYFVLSLWLTLAGILISIFLWLYGAGLISMISKDKELSTVLNFGIDGVLTMFSEFPVVPLLITLFAISSTYLFSTRFETLYSQPIVFRVLSVLIALSLICIIGLTLDRNNGIPRAINNNIPQSLLGERARSKAKPPIIRGIIEDLTIEDGIIIFTLQTNRGTATVFADDQTFIRVPLEEGGSVGVLGIREGDQILARTIRRMD